MCSEAVTLTLVIINKTGSDLIGNVSLARFTLARAAPVFRERGES